MSNDLTALRSALFETLRDVRAGSIDLDRARAVNEIGKTLVDSAKVEVAYIKAAGGGESSFLDSAVGTANLPPGITGRTVHKIR